MYSATMTLRRFMSISSYLRFDEQGTRQVHLETDKLTSISYTGESVTIEEQVVPYRG